MKMPTQWIVTADERLATLHSCNTVKSGGPVPGSRWDIEPVKSFEGQFGHFHDQPHHNHANTLGHAATGNTVQHQTAHGRDDAEEHRHFARDVSAWLTNAVKELDIECVHVFAARRFLGLLREIMGDLYGHVILHEGEFTRLTPHKLAEHPAIKSLLEAALTGSKGGR